MELDLAKEVLHLVDRMAFVPRIRTRDVLAGRHKSPRSGTSTDFLEYRDYSPGEYAGDIDWKASARLDRVLVKRKEHAGLIQNWLVLDGSSSMAFPSPESSKYRMQVILAGVISHLLVAQGDSVGLAMEKEAAAFVTFPPKRTREGVTEIVRDLCSYFPRNSSSSVIGACRFISGRLRRPAVVWVMTDLDSEPSTLMEAAGTLVERGHEVRLFHLVHPYEEDLPWKGNCLFQDLEYAFRDRLLHPEHLAALYREIYKEHVACVSEGLGSMGAAFQRIDVTSPLEDILPLIFSEQ